MDDDDADYMEEVSRPALSVGAILDMPATIRTPSNTLMTTKSL